MDTSPNLNPRLSVSETGAGNEAQSTNSPSRPSVAEESPPSPAPAASLEQFESVPPAHPPAPTQTPMVEPGQAIEHAYWAEYEEDTTTPGEDELKEIEGADADYSACDREYHPNTKH